MPRRLVIDCVPDSTLYLPTPSTMLAPPSQPRIWKPLNTEAPIGPWQPPEDPRPGYVEEEEPIPVVQPIEEPGTPSDIRGCFLNLYNMFRNCCSNYCGSRFAGTVNFMAEGAGYLLSGEFRLFFWFVNGSIFLCFAKTKYCITTLFAAILSCATIYFNIFLENPISSKTVETYSMLTIFTRTQIYELHNLYSFLTRHIQGVPAHEITLDATSFLQRLPYFWVSPFKDRIVKIFSHDGANFTFEDFIDVMMAFNKNCPKYKKAEYIFRMFDMDDSGSISTDDLKEVVRRMGSGCGVPEFEAEYREYFCHFFMNFADNDEDRYMNIAEFYLMMINFHDHETLFHISPKIPGINIVIEELAFL